jgi:dTDP-glucose pyrophosphorylase
MLDWKKITLLPHHSIRCAMEIIGRESSGIALVVSEQNELLGLITDGDIRRGLLRSYKLEDCVELIMNKNPAVAYLKDSKKQRMEILKKAKIRQLPILSENKKVVMVEVLKADLNKSIDNVAFLIAGGLGTRLKPLTDNLPKPLLRLGGKPILQIIIESLIESGITKFYLSVNYLADMFVEHFGNGEKWGVEIYYIFENEPMGTAGSLSLLKEIPKSPIIVMNADLLTKIDICDLLSFHKDHGSKATMCVRDYDFQVPYGVVQTKENILIDITEKPKYKFFVNAGIYIISPEVISEIPLGQPFTMPELLKKINRKENDVSVFPIHEYWLDIGQLEDFKRAQSEVDKIFK